MPSTLYNPDGTRTGLRINARSRRTYHMGGEPRGGLFTEPTKGEKWEMHERARARRDAAASMPSTAAVTAAPAKPQADGMLVLGPSGSAVWKTNEQLAKDAQIRERAAARRRAGTPGTAEFVGPILPKPAATFEGMSKERYHLERNWRNFQTPGRMTTANTASPEELQRLVEHSRRQIDRDIERGYTREAALRRAGMLPEDMDPRE